MAEFPRLTAAWQTSDGSVFLLEMPAQEHQKKLNFERLLDVYLIGKSSSQQFMAKTLIQDIEADPKLLQAFFDYLGTIKIKKVRTPKEGD